MKYARNVGILGAPSHSEFDSFGRWDSQNENALPFPNRNDLHKTRVVYCSKAVPVSSAADFDLKLIFNVNKVAGQHVNIIETQCYFCLNCAWIV